MLTLGYRVRLEEEGKASVGDLEDCEVEEGIPVLELRAVREGALLRWYWERREGRSCVMRSEDKCDW